RAQAAQRRSAARSLWRRSFRAAPGIALECRTGMRSMHSQLTEEHQELDQTLADVEYLADRRSYMSAARRFGELRRNLQAHLVGAGVRAGCNQQEMRQAQRLRFHRTTITGLLQT